MSSVVPNPEVVWEVPLKPNYTSNPNPKITNFKTKSDPLNNPIEVLRTSQDVHTSQKCTLLVEWVFLGVNLKDVEEHTHTHTILHTVYTFSN